MSAPGPEQSNEPFQDELAGEAGDLQPGDGQSATTAGMQPARSQRLSPRARAWRAGIAGSALLLALVVMLGSIPSLREGAVALLVGPTATATVPPTATLLPTFAPTHTPLPTATPQPLGAVPQNCLPGQTPQPFDASFTPGVGDGPLRVMFEGNYPTIRLDPSTGDYTQYGWGVSLIVALQLSAPDGVLLQGENLDTGSALWFNFSFLPQQPTTALMVSANLSGQYGDSQWTSWIGYLYIPAAGCYALEASWPEGHWQIFFAAGQ
jgi:hypothetical protein